MKAERNVRATSRRHVLWGNSEGSGIPVRKSKATGCANALRSEIDSQRARGRSGPSDRRLAFPRISLRARSLTNGRAPRRDVTKPSLANRSYAKITVMRDTASARARSRLDDRRSPGRSRPSRIARLICRWISPLRFLRPTKLTWKAMKSLTRAGKNWSSEYCTNWHLHQSAGAYIRVLRVGVLGEPKGLGCSPR